LAKVIKLAQVLGAKVVSNLHSKVPIEVSKIAVAGLAGAAAAVLLPSAALPHALKAIVVSKSKTAKKIFFM
jgi:hypothetical protein